VTIRTVQLRHLAEVRVSNVDKKTVDGEVPVRLCNYTDVYYQDSITSDIDFMPATASISQVRAFELRAGDSIITKDSETASDIGVPAYVPKDLPGVVCGYHLALIRPRGDELDSRYFRWTLRSDFVREQLINRASGVTRYGLTYGAIQSAEIPIVGDPVEQRRIADFLDAQLNLTEQAAALRRDQVQLAKERSTAAVDEILQGLDVTTVPLGQLLGDGRPVNYGVLMPGTDMPGGVPLVEARDLGRGELDVGALRRTDPEIEREYRRSRLLPGDLVMAIRGSVGAVQMIPPDAPPLLNVTRDAARISLAPEKVRPGYVMYQLRGPRIQSWLRERMLGSAVKGINIGDLKRLPILVCSFADQEAVEAELKRVDAVTTSLEATVEGHRGLLLERKRALITSAVMGNLDVSSAPPQVAAVVSG
jgi:type I restriction enzyme S subunit